MLLYVYTIITLVILDSIWILGIAKSFYKKQLGFLFMEKANMIPIIVFYILYSFGLVYLITSQAIVSNENIFKVWLSGFILGLMTYGAYDLTNHATIANWPISVTIVDMLWGGVVTSLAVLIPYLVIKP